MNRGSYRSSRPCRIVLFTSLVSISACAADPGFDGRSTVEWINQLKSPAPQARQEAADALGHVLQIDPNKRDAIDALALAIRDSSDDVRMAAAEALTTEGVDPVGALAGFHNALHDSVHSQVRSSFARLIGVLGPKRGRVLIPALSENIDDADADVRAATIESLGMLGPDGRIDVQRIARRASDTDPSVRRAVLQTLLNLRIAPSVTVPVARSALRDSASSVRMAAAYALASLGSGAIPAVAELRNALKDPDPTVRKGAAFAIGTIGPAASVAIPDLTRLYADSSREVVAEARAAVAVLEGKKVANMMQEPSQMEKCAANPHALGC